MFHQRNQRTHRIIMDPTLYNAAMRGNIGDANFLLADHLKRDEENGYQVTPKGNTVLHVAALYGHSNFAREVLKITPALLCCENKKNETALHIAANEGHTEVVCVLLACVEDHNTKEKLTRMTDASGDTVLHKAVRSQHRDVVKLLVKEDSEFEFPPNHAQETPLYLAAESGFHDALIIILESCKKLTYAAGPSNRTPLHAAVIQEHKGSDKCDSLVDEPDSDGNTPLHLLAASGNHMRELINHPRAKKMSFNKQNQTPLDIALSCKATTKKEKLVEDLCIIGRFGKRDFEVKRKYEYMHNPNDETGTGVKMQLREDDHDKANKASQTVESIMKIAQIHIVVATLIMIVTFAAGITLPGGFESDPNSHNQGMVILTRKTAFRAFVVSNDIALTCSAVAIFIYFLMADESRGPPHLEIVNKLYDLAAIFQCLSMFAVVIAFATGIDSVAAYFTKLKNLWNEYDAMISTPSCTCPKSKEYVDHVSSFMSQDRALVTETEKFKVLKIGLSQTVPTVSNGISHRLKQYPISSLLFQGHTNFIHDLDNSFLNSEV
ncbi:hypothetical protein BC332_14157 [Capsicum chinense]|nr:hypothetical protein BC332_14157 [Capsicum chinense]